MPIKKVQWSKNRPKKPDIDPLLVQIQSALGGDKRSKFKLADASGLSTSTFYNWEKNKVKHPKGMSLQMAGAMLGLELKFVPKKRTVSVEQISTKKAQPTKAKQKVAA